MLKQVQTQKQQHTILPQQIELLNLFHLNRLELDQRIVDELSENPALEELGSGDESANGFIRTVKWKVLPFPYSLSTQMWPPIRPTNRLQIVRPSPVPPRRRVEELSACVNASKIRFLRVLAVFFGGTFWGLADFWGEFPCACR